MPGLKPQTTYYYKVTSTESTGKSDGVESRVNQFTTTSSPHLVPASKSWRTLHNLHNLRSSGNGNSCHLDDRVTARSMAGMTRQFLHVNIHQIAVTESLRQCRHFDIGR
jgi:hypothetical protein